MNLLWVFLGGGLGAAARYGIARLLPTSDLGAGGFPWATLLANLLACALLGVALAYVLRGQLPRSGELLLVTGFCGGFSTFSTFAAELLLLLQSGNPVSALLYLVVSLLVGVGTVAIALLLLRPELT